MAEQLQRKRRQRRMEGKDGRMVTREGKLPELWKPDYAGEAKTLARLLVEDPIYLTNLQARMRAGTVAPAVENMVWERAFGKVKEEVEVRKIESIRIVHEYLEDDRASQMAALKVLPGEVVEAKLLGEHTEQSTGSHRAGQGDGDSPAVVAPAGEGHEDQGAVLGSGGERPVGEDDGSDLEAH